MLRPQVFALYSEGEEAVQIGLVASETPGHRRRPREPARGRALPAGAPTWYWNARGGSYTDGGAFAFTVSETGGRRELVCTDKFGRSIGPDPEKLVPFRRAGRPRSPFRCRSRWTRSPRDLRTRRPAPASLGYGDLRSYLVAIEGLATDAGGVRRAIAALTLLMDRRVPTGRQAQRCNNRPKKDAGQSSTSPSAPRTASMS